MKTPVSLRLAVCLLLFMAESVYATTTGSEFTGRWEITTSYPGGSYIAGLEITAVGDRYAGRSGYLVPDGYF